MAFSAWSFVFLCRPQDYILFLNPLRPGVILILITLVLYVLNKSSFKEIAYNRQVKLYQYLVILIVIGVPFSYYPRFSLYEFFLYCNVVLFFFLFYQIVNSISDLRNIIFLYCMGASIYALFALKTGNFDNERLSFSDAFDPNDLAFYLLSFLTFNFIFISKTNSKFIRISSVVSLIVTALVILKTGSRGGLIALLSVITVLLFTKSQSIKLSFMSKAALCIVAFVSVQYTTINTVRFKTLLVPESDYNYTDETGRKAIWKTGIKLMLSHPLVGIGMNAFPEGIGRERKKEGAVSLKWQTAHNSLVQIGAETGVFGLILFCAMSFNAFKIFGQIAKKTRFEELAKIGEMARVGFLGHFIIALFLSQAYSVYWAFYIVLSAVLKQLLDKETEVAEIIT